MRKITDQDRNDPKLKLLIEQEEKRLASVKAKKADSNTKTKRDWAAEARRDIAAIKGKEEAERDLKAQRTALLDQAHANYIASRTRKPNHTAEDFKKIASVMDNVFVPTMSLDEQFIAARTRDVNGNIPKRNNVSNNYSQSSGQYGGYSQSAH